MTPTTGNPAAPSKPAFTIIRERDAKSFSPLRRIVNDRDVEVYGVQDPETGNLIYISKCGDGQQKQYGMVVIPGTLPAKPLTPEEIAALPKPGLGEPAPRG
jgi:hypothetical protein